MSNINFTKLGTLWPDFHVLSYAETGFAPLNIHTKNSNISRDELISFASKVNETNSVMTLHPIVPISAIPRRLIRQQLDPQLLQQSIEDFLKLNLEKIGARKVLIDFSTPQLKLHAREAINAAVLSTEAQFVEEFLIVSDADASF